MIESHLVLLFGRLGKRTPDARRTLTAGRTRNRALARWNGVSQSVYPSARPYAMLQELHWPAAGVTRVDEQPGVATDQVGAAALDFEEFFLIERSRLYGTLCLVTGNRYEAEEVGQEAFARVWERWDRVSLLEDPVGYLHTVAMNVFRSRYRRARVAARNLLRGEATEDDTGRVDDRDELSRLLAELTPRERAAVVLTGLYDYSSEEAGRILGIRASTVRVLTTRARATLAARREER